MTEEKTLWQKLSSLRAQSEAAWEMAADTARDESAAAKFVESWDAWGEHWDEAESLIESEEWDAAIASFDAAHSLEQKGGDASFSERAIELVKAHTVTIEEMPEHLASSHRAAGNWGSYPVNGAVRRRVTRETADSIIANDEDEYARIVA